MLLLLSCRYRMSKTSLRFDPDFDDLPFNNNSVSLTVFNEHSQGLICKAQTKPDNCYEINQSYFFLLPSIKVVVIINFNNTDDDDDRSDHEIIVQWLPISETAVTENAENYWKQTSKSRRKEILHRTFGCAFTNQDAPSISDRAIVPIGNQALQKAESDVNIEKLGKMAIDGHTTIAQLNFEFSSLIDKMEAENAQQLNDIVRVLCEIAKEYKHLEHQTRSTINKTQSLLSEVINTASSKQLKPSEKIELMRQDFSELANEFDELAKRHGDISQQLAVQANKAEATKEENDLRARKAEELREHAQVCGILGTPGVGLVSSVAACTMAAANSVDGPILKALASVGAVLGGIGVGIVVTVGSPILLTIAAALVAKSKAWSVKFQSMHEMIRKLQNFMDQASQCLSDINSDLKTLSHVTSQAKQKQDRTALDHAFGRVTRSCERVMESCTKYVQLADANTKKMKEIKKSSSK